MKANLGGFRTFVQWFRYPGVTFTLLLLFSSCDRHPDLFLNTQVTFQKALENGRQANEAIHRSVRFVHGWLDHADSTTGLIPRNLDSDRDIWNGKDSAADNYPFMVLTAAITDSALLERMLDMLQTEKRLTSRVGSLPDIWSFTEQSFVYSEPDMDRLIFNGSEYVKDGLLPLTEWLGTSPWSDRMINIVDDIWEHARYDTPAGKLPSLNREVNGEMMQVLARLYWMTGQPKYLDYAIRLASYYLLHNLPTEQNKRIRLRDHGCEVISGLTEVYAALHFGRIDKKNLYRDPLHKMLDTILEIGRNEHGFFYNWVNPITREHDDEICDTFGYNYNGFYTVFLLDELQSYRDAVIECLSNLQYYHEYDWEGNSADGYADAIEGALNLYNREPMTSAALWIDQNIKIMWSKQQPSGIIEGWHGDGNFARTSIMYALWKSKGITIKPWRNDIVLGAVTLDDNVYIALSASNAWQGQLIFDAPRHKSIMRLPIDYPRINQFPEWHTVENEQLYRVYFKDGSAQSVSGEHLRSGLAISLTAGQERHLIISPETTNER